MTMLRARKKDVRIKPNRKLDKRSSRGMLYENEELRLRTIEINAEVERGQTDIKKLRRENDYLRRRMWALRDEYERLEKLIKHLDLAGTSQTASLNGCSDDSDQSDCERGGTSGTSTRRPSSSAAGASSSNVPKCLRSAHGHDAQHAALAAAAAAAAVYVECNNPDMDNIQNYQKAYGRMPRRCSSAGGRVYRGSAAPSIHFLPAAETAAAANTAAAAAAAATSAASEPRSACYESVHQSKHLSGSSGNCATGMEEDEDGYAACSHPPLRRQFLRPPSLEMMAPPLPPPPLPPPPLVIPLGYHQPASGAGSAAEAGSSEGGAAAGGEGEACPLVPPDTPSEDGHFNLDHLVNIVRSFREEQQLHQSGLLITGSSTPSEEDDDEEEDDDDDDDDTEEVDEEEEEEEADEGEDEEDEEEEEEERGAAAPAAPAATAAGMAEKSKGILVPLPPAASFRRAVAVAEERSRSTSPDSPGRFATVKRQRRKQMIIEKVSSDGTQRQQIVRRSVERLSSLPPGSGGGAGAAAGSSSHSGSVVGAAGSSTTEQTQQSVTFTRSSNPSGVVTKHSVTFRQNSVVFLNNNNSSSNNNNTSTNTSPSSPAKGPSPSRKSRHHSSSSATKVSGEKNVIHLPEGATASAKELSKANSLSLYPLPDTDAASLLRLHAVDPYTVSVDLMDHPASIRQVTVQGIIDQLEEQLDPTACVVRGVRMVGAVVYISLDSSRSLSYLMRHSFRIQGVPIRPVDVSSQLIIGLSGVPHYISDTTVAMLLAAFGQVIGDVERRFLEGVDTGERFIRLKIRPHVKMPRHITVGGCRIQVRRVAPAPTQEPAYKPAPPVKRVPPTDAVSGAGSGEYSTLDAYRRRSEDADCVPLLSAAAGVSAGEEDSSPHRKKPGSVPKIGRAFEYRSHLRVNLRMSAEVAKFPETPTSTPTTKTPPCPVCELQVHPLSVQGLACLTSSKPATPSSSVATPRTSQCSNEAIVHRCREAAGSLTPPATGGTGSNLSVAAESRLRESPPKTRVSVNFEETPATTVTSKGSSSGRNSKPPTSASNGILRKSASGDDSNLEADPPSGASGTAEGAKGKNGLRPTVTASATVVAAAAAGTTAAAVAAASAKKTGRSFSLVDTFRVKDRRKPIVRVETVVENTSANPEDGAQGVKTSVVRRDSVSSSRSSRSSHKSNDLPWCGCWGNGCL